ncbi:tetratricopeptide repeat protein [Gracilimonas sp.]|uniref:tetratricopeptide repeat protein n=1 Tax=Gracilimonas sp. TaxID=1974203 RepID=UPI0025C46A0D|nr:tetratricopeptide repeat protein [Gracilimonas sp.]
MKSLIPVFLILSFLLISCQPEKKQPDFESLPISVQTISLLGDTLKTDIQAIPQRYLIRIDSLSKLTYQEDRMVDHMIGEARKTAYAGDYRQAVQLFTDAINQFPDKPRLYRHRGHRYITLRAFDLAIDDFQRAAKLFEGQPDITEKDGLPNEQNIPLSTLQTNTWYHLGLAHYLKGEYDQANLAYENGLQVSDNTDMRVAFLYWKYMTLRKLGRDAKAGALLEQVSPDMELIENTSYHELLMVFKGVFSPDEIITEENSELDNATLGYGLGFWHHINGRGERAKEIWQGVYEVGNWAAFGYIASEAELAQS